MNIQGQGFQKLENYRQTCTRTDASTTLYSWVIVIRNNGDNTASHWEAECSVDVFSAHGVHYYLFADDTQS